MMHSSGGAVVMEPPKGEALLLELGELIVSGRVAIHPDQHRQHLQAKLCNNKALSSVGDASLNSSVGVGGGGEIARLVLRQHTEALWKERIPLCIEVLLQPSCTKGCRGPLLLLERWTMQANNRRAQDPSNHITSQWLLNAVRSQLHFSQISAWAAKLGAGPQAPTQSERQRKLSRETCNIKKYESNLDEEEELRNKMPQKTKLNIVYSVKIPGETYKMAEFQTNPTVHKFPLTDIGGNTFLNVSLESLPRSETIPIVRCNCSNNLSAGTSSGSPQITLKRRRSRDLMGSIVPNAFTEDILANTLAATCTLADSKSKAFYNSKTNEDNCRMKGPTFSPDQSIINSDIGCSSGISRKFPTYSTPNNSAYHNSNSRDSTPEFNDVNDSGISLAKGDGPLHDACKRKSVLTDYQFFVVPPETVKANYALVDDRMQTPCRQKGKHRCNCDEESDQGQNKETVHGKEFKSAEVKENIKEERQVLDERRMKEIAKYKRRLRKEAKLKQLMESGRSSQENSESNAETDARLNAIRSMHDISESVHYRNYHNCFNRTSESEGRNCQGKAALQESSAGKKNTSEGNSLATSIPILQASRFDHVNRFSNFRNTAALHSVLPPREALPLKDLNCVCASIGCNLMASVKQFYRADGKLASDTSNSTYQRDCSSSCCKGLKDEGRARLNNSGDNYRPSVKKLISSYTQTDEVSCQCGKALIPMCLECDLEVQPRQHQDLTKKMKRSEARMDLSTINKSKLLLEAMERTSRLKVQGAQEECKQDEGAKDVNNCDNSVLNNNYRECDKTDNVDLTSCSNELELSSHSQDNDLKQDGDNLKVSNAPSSPNVDFIKKPKLKRLAVVDRIEKIMAERIEHRTKRDPAHYQDKSYLDLINLNEPAEDSDEDFLYKDEESGITYMTSPSQDNGLVNHCYRTNSRKHSRSINNHNPTDDEKLIVTYEKGQYGNFGSNNKKHNDSVLKTSEEREIDRSKLSHVKRNLHNTFCSDHNHNGDTPNGSESKQSRMKRITEEGKALKIGLLEQAVAVPSVSEMDRFRWRLDSAASMVFHSRTGLPLTSSPAPLRRGKSCFDYDSTINSVSGIKSALYGECECESDVEACGLGAWSPGSSPGSPGPPPCAPPALPPPLPAFTFPRQPKPPRSHFRHGTSSGLLGSFEESVLNGRLEPAATVAGFMAEIGASGAFCPPHLRLPVTVFFYSLGDNTTCAPYLGHINLGRKGYCVPHSGTIQATLFNPHGTVVKMFVVMYDLTEMPPHSRTFLRQRTLCVPVGQAEGHHKCLRYLIHLRFLTSKSGKVYLHTDIRMIVSRKADLDTAAAHSLTSALAVQRRLSGEEPGARKKKYVETGTFKRRTPASSASSAVNGVANSMKGMNRSVGCFELAAHCVNESPDSKCCINNNNINNGALECSNGNHSNCTPNNKSSNLLLSVTNCCQNNGIYIALPSGSPRVEKATEVKERPGSSTQQLSLLSKELSYELRSFTVGPENPKYSPR